MKVKVHLVREAVPKTEDSEEILKDSKDVIVEAPSVCEGIVSATKANAGYHPIRSEIVAEEVSKN